MKRVSIITIIDNNNFGTFLQAFALCKKLEDLGRKPELVDYCRPHMTMWSSYFTEVKKLSNPLKWISRLLTTLASANLHRKDRWFIKKYLSKRSYSSYEQLVEHPPFADVYMTGSDQVWNSIHNRGLDKSFFLDYAPHGAHKVAYAASVGMPSFQEWEKAETLQLLQDYDAITLREESSVDLLSDLGLDRSKLAAVIDPTLLLTKEEWKQQISDKRIHDEKYVLVYSVEEKKQNTIIGKIAQRIAKERGLKVVGVYYGTSYSAIPGCDYNHYRATPDVFLNLMYYADFVVVSSFHGTVFSINFQKEFITVTPNRFNSRVNDILKLTGLESRLVKDIDTFCWNSEPINFNMVNGALMNERLDAINKLMLMLK